MGVIKHWNRFPRGDLQPLNLTEQDLEQLELQAFNYPFCEQDVGLEDLQRSHPTKVILWVFDLCTTNSCQLYVDTTKTILMGLEMFSVLVYTEVAEHPLTALILLLFLFVVTFGPLCFNVCSFL